MTGPAGLIEGRLTLVNDEVFQMAVYGRPAPQGSKTTGRTKTGRSFARESSKYLKTWRGRVELAAALTLEQYGRDNEFWVPPHLLGAVVIERMTFSIERAARPGRGLTEYPAKAPDLSKLVRGVEDSLTCAGVWKDDAKVVRYELIEKVYAGSDHEYALPRPGVFVRVREI